LDSWKDDGWKEDSSNSWKIDGWKEDSWKKDGTLPQGPPSAPSHSDPPHDELERTSALSHSMFWLKEFVLALLGFTLVAKGRTCLLGVAFLFNMTAAAADMATVAKSHRLVSVKNMATVAKSHRLVSVKSLCDVSCVYHVILNFKRHWNSVHGNQKHRSIDNQTGKMMSEAIKQNGALLSF
jgi:hypothetical protein